MQKIHYRKIKENEEGLLDGIWNGLERLPEDTQAGKADFSDVRKRIRAEERKRRNTNTLPGSVDRIWNFDGGIAY